MVLAGGLTLKATKDGLNSGRAPAFSQDCTCPDAREPRDFVTTKNGLQPFDDRDVHPLQSR
jgi:hypothetical protein